MKWTQRFSVLTACAKVVFRDHVYVYSCSTPVLLLLLFSNLQWLADMDTYSPNMI